MELIPLAPGSADMAALEALEHPEEFTRMTQSYLARRDLWQARMAQIPAVRCRVAEGTFYGWMHIEKDGMDSAAIAAYLLEEARVVVVPGTAYGEKGPGWVRVSLATAAEDLERAADRLAAALK